jgi:hypothetical protein
LSRDTQEAATLPTLTRPMAAMAAVGACTPIAPEAEDGQGWRLPRTQPRGQEI